MTEGWTALTYASWLAHTAIIELLIGAGADIEAETKYGWRPLMMAAANGQTDAVNRLLSAGALLDAGGNDTAMTWAAAEGRVETLRFLLEQGANPDGPEYPEMSRALWTAVSYDRTEVIRLLAKHGADLEVHDRFGNTALARASSTGKIHVAAALLAAGVSDSLHNAAARGDMQALEHLIDADSLKRCNLRSQTPLHCAALGGHTKIVDRLLQEPDVSLEDPVFTGLLSAAAMSGSESTVALLIEKGSKVKELNNLPLVNAVANASLSGSSAIVEKLLTLGANPNSVDGEGWPVLFAAVHAHDYNLTHSLLVHGANVHQKGPENASLLEALGCQGQDEKLTALLKQYGLDPE